MLTKNKLLFGTIIVVWLIATFACSIGGIQSQIVGRWREASGTGLELEFFNGGTVTATILGITTTGNYTFLDNDSIRVDFTGIVQNFFGSQTFDVAINNDRLTLTYNGTGLQFVKVR